jgi:periodic tryptophan protein 1
LDIHLLTVWFNQVSLENGLVLNFDVRTLPSNLEDPSPSRFTLAAHDGPASALDVNPHLKGCIVTGGTDKLVKVWNIQDNEDTGKRNVSLVTSRDLGVVGFSDTGSLVLSLISSTTG